MMMNDTTAPADQPLTALILDLFRLNNQLLAAGDRLVAPVGLTSARWQVLGAIHAAMQPQPVAWLARDMGANRQNVQRIVNDLASDGLVAFRANPHHRRAQLVVMTPAGQSAFAAAMALQGPWVDALAAGLDPAAITAAHAVLGHMLQRLASD